MAIHHFEVIHPYISGRKPLEKRINNRALCPSRHDLDTMYKQSYLPVVRRYMMYEQPSVARHTHSTLSARTVLARGTVHKFSWVGAAPGEAGQGSA